MQAAGAACVRALARRAALCSNRAHPRRALTLSALDDPSSSSSPPAPSSSAPEPALPAWKLPVEPVHDAASMHLREELARAAAVGDMTHIETTLAQLEEMRVPYDTLMLVHVLKCHEFNAVVGESERVVAVWQRALQRGLAPNKACFSALLRCMTKCRDVLRADAVMVDMKAAGHTPDVWDYVTLIKAHGKVCRE